MGGAKDEAAPAEEAGANGKVSMSVSDTLRDQWVSGARSPKLGNTAVQILDLNLHEDPMRKANVSRYFSLCSGVPGLHVTTSCFTIWRKNKKTNGYAKVIPALPDRKVNDSTDNVRIFFFDDNLEWDGAEESPGICNLREVETGDFVSFGEGVNGFRREYYARHTVIHVSNAYRNVLVKANILDAMEDVDYFAGIIRRYALPNERLIVYMDVNSTIVCNDSVQGKDISATLLSTMFEFIELRPESAFDFQWESHAPVNISKAKSLKTVMKDLTKDDNQAYSTFFTQARCLRFLEELAYHGEIRWSSRPGKLTREVFMEAYNDYLEAVAKDINKDGITTSWFKVWDSLKEGRHTVVLNSFGVDTRKVILATVPDEKKVLQITVNYALWDERDTQKFESQFAAEETVSSEAPVRTEAATTRKDPARLWWWERLLGCCTNPTGSQEPVRSSCPGVWRTACS
mmetsp:Transcript_13579/g.29882  ORF Transcript_13579/g.29882 Transcript_13579/m.29882 type:complete len:458 (+) Transcript_13579:107-1480(+)